MDNTTTTDRIARYQSLLYQAEQLDADWIDVGMPDTLSSADACQISRWFDVRPDGEWIWNHDLKVTRFDLAYYITTNRD